MLRPLLIPLTYFCLQTWLGIPQAKCQVQLSMMDDAFDDQYLGCAKEMDTKARELLKEEMTSPFNMVWQKATETWKNMKSISRPRGFKDEYGIAIVAYTNDTKYNGKTFSSTFNDAVSGTNRSRAAYMDNFKFKAFHYYLTRALQFLRGKCNVMYNKMVYRGTKVQYTGSGKIRFGFFASSSISRKVAEDFGTGTIFTIRTCFGAQIMNMSYNHSQEEVLIPVHEIFSVVKRQGNNFILQSTNQTYSHFNCVYLCGEEDPACIYNTATRGGLAFPSVLSSPLFGGSIILAHAAALKLFAGF